MADLRTSDILAADWARRAREILERNSTPEAREFRKTSIGPRGPRILEDHDLRSPDQVAADIILGRGTGRAVEDLLTGLTPLPGAITEARGGESGILDWVPGGSPLKAGALAIPLILGRLNGRTGKEAYKFIAREMAQDVVNDIAKSGKTPTPDVINSTVGSLFQQLDGRALDKAGLNKQAARMKMYDEVRSMVNNTIDRANIDITAGRTPDFNVNLLDDVDERASSVVGGYTTDYANLESRRAAEGNMRRLQNMSEEEREAFMNANRERAARQRANMTEEERQAYRERMAASKRARIAAMTPEELQAYKEYNRLKESERVANMTPEEKAARRKAHSDYERERQRAIRESMDPEIKAQVALAGKEARIAAKAEAERLGITDKKQLASFLQNAKAKAQRAALKELQQEQAALSPAAQVLSAVDEAPVAPARVTEQVLAEQPVAARVMDEAPAQQVDDFEQEYARLLAEEEQQAALAAEREADFEREFNQMLADEEAAKNVDRINTDRAIENILADTRERRFAKEIDDEEILAAARAANASPAEVIASGWKPEEHRLMSHRLYPPEIKNPENKRNYFLGDSVATEVLRGFDPRHPVTGKTPRDILQWANDARYIRHQGTNYDKLSDTYADILEDLFKRGRYTAEKDASGRTVLEGKNYYREMFKDQFNRLLEDELRGRRR